MFDKPTGGGDGPQFISISLGELLAATRRQYSLESVLAGLQGNSNLAHIRAAQRETSCCHEGAHRDALLVAALSPDGVRGAVAIEAENPACHVAVYAVDVHTGRVLQLSFDVAGLEQHVNNCTEVLAYVRCRNEEMAAAQPQV